MAALYIFTRDLRLYDNQSLQACLSNKEVEAANLIFIFNPDQITDSNKYISYRSIKFMVESLADLASNVHVDFFYGYPDKVVRNIVQENQMAKPKLFIMQDYTPYARERAAKLATIAPITQSHDAMLLDVSAMVSGSGKPYVKFTPFYTRMRMCKVPEPKSLRHCNKISDKPLKSKYKTTLEKMAKLLNLDNITGTVVCGGRSNALGIVKAITNGKFDQYKQERDFPHKCKTTHLSAYIKFGCVSIREVFKACSSIESLARQLYWHDFYTQLAYHNPHVFVGSFRRKFDNLAWNLSIADNKTTVTKSADPNVFVSWCNGETGYNIIDAAMKQMNEEGWMPNRMRMIVADFLIKILHVDWKLGELYFANNLVDYDPSINNGSWQFHASTGVDSQPYFRIFNPVAQAKKFDRECLYITTYLPELQNKDNKKILTNEISHTKPIVQDYNKEKEKTIAEYIRVSKSQS